MKIGIDISGYTSLIGAFDFITNVVIALSYCAKKYGHEIFLIARTDDKSFYRKYKGIKKLLYKIKYFIRFNSISDYRILPNCEYFAELDNIKLLEINKHYRKVLRNLNFDVVLPITNPKLNISPILSIRYLFDCQHKYYPQFFSKEILEYRDIYFSEMVKKPCIVNSQDAKKDFVNFYNADTNKIFSLPFTPKIKEEYILVDKPEILEKYNLPKKYFLMSCQFWLHKDHSTLFKAFAKFINKIDVSDIGLVCTGTMEEPRKPEHINELKDLIKDLGIEKKVYLLGCIPKRDQLEIMKKSIAVVNTTLFEGGPGGGCIWDSCALGIRSIISDIPVNLEIKDNLVHFFKKGNADDLCNKMIELLTNPLPIYTKEELLAKSQENINILGDKLIDIIQEVIEQNKRGE